jgi:prepilin-type N-terminal cleavage/methylation domain-containing protein/prepilin-type processing-associated H-X9-DG protein
MKISHPSPRRDVRKAGGFTLIELLVTIAIIGVLAAILLPAVNNAMAKGRTANCASNLKEIFNASLAYSGDNGDKIPYAVLRWRAGTANTWDDLLFTYLGGESGMARYEQLIGSQPQLGQGGPADSNNDGNRLLKCPSDKARRSDTRYNNGGRSYVMPTHAMARNPAPSWAPNVGPNGYHWPPSPKNATGVGFNWDVSSGPTADWEPEDPVDPIPRRQKALFEDLILKPEETIIYTERVRREMLQGSFQFQTINNARQHLIGNINRDDYNNVQRFHLGRFNYMMADGHVETLTPEESIGVDSTDTSVQAGYWTITPDD